MEVTGTIIKVLDQVEGQGANGIWKKKSFILETEGQYPKKVCIDLWNDKVDGISLVVGEKVSVSIEIASREYKGKWYTDVRAWRILSEVNLYDKKNNNILAIDEIKTLDTFGDNLFDDEVLPF